MNEVNLRFLHDEINPVEYVSYDGVSVPTYTATPKFVNIPKDILLGINEENIFK